MPVPIPSPKGIPLLGNINDVDPVNSLVDLIRLGDTYGEIFKLQLGGQTRVFVTNRALCDEVCDESKWQKVVSAALAQVRDVAGDGLFTAFNDEHNWGVAHRVLMPAFGPMKMKEMYDEMHDIASQLLCKWARFGPTEKINVPDEFTRLTLDSIALCAMGVRFNSFYKDKMHPFVDAMVDALMEAGPRARRPAIANYFMRTANQKWEYDAQFMKEMAGEMLADRLKHPTDKEDLLNAMINGRDPKTGEGLSEESIVNNMVTFLIAGHETTSGLLSFLFYYLLKHPSVYQAAQKEVDQVVGNGPVNVEHMSQLPYINACLRETLRLKPTAPAFTLTPRPEQGTILLGGKYEIEQGTSVMCVLEKIHQDPAVWGDDANEFKPERMLDEPFSKLPKNAWKPFGNGMRGCIGRPFAWQEALLMTTLLLQNFNFRFDDPSYNLLTKQSLTIKPKDFYMHATLRNGLDVTHLEKKLHVDPAVQEKRAEHGKNGVASSKANKAKSPLSIFYGSNAGTCESLARSLFRTATSRGFQVSIEPLDVATGKVPKGQPVIIITSSYEGQPPDNAAHFVEWLAGLKQGNELKGVNYAVYGCGNRDWATTFHKVPKTIDSSFEANGATRIAETGLGDVAAGDIFNDFDIWEDKILWPALGGDDDSNETGLDVEIDTTSRPSSLRQDVKEAVVLSNELLTSGGDAEKRHIKLKLPTEMSYNVGDYIAVLPLNHINTVRRVLKKFGLPWDSMLTIKSNTTLPSHPVSATDILTAYVELSQPATRKYVMRISASIPDEELRNKVSLLATDKFEEEIAAKRRSPLDILEEFPSAQLPFGEFLAMCAPIRVRQYSISSSPLSEPDTASLTFSVLDSQASGKRFLGVASNYLSNLEAGDHIHIAIKPSHGNFHPPTSIENTPLIMICAGTGIAPFRGFIQERAMQIAAGRKLAPAYLFIGCAHPDWDMLFKSELEEWESIGAVKTFYAFSKAKEQSKGCRHVQDRLWEEREEMVKVFDEGAKLYVCGSNAMSEGVAHTIKRTYMEAAEARGKDKTEEEVQTWFDGIKSDRYSTDVFT